MFARMSRYAPVARGTCGTPDTGNRIERQAAACTVIARQQFGEKNRTEQRTLKLRVRGSSPWRRSPDRLFCHVYGRGKGQAQMIPGWPYSVVAALAPGRTSWTAVRDAIRLGPGDDAAGATAAQVREVARRLIAAGHWRDGDPPILVIAGNLSLGLDRWRLSRAGSAVALEVPRPRHQCLRGASSANSPENAPHRPGCRCRDAGRGAENDSAVTAAPGAPAYRGQATARRAALAPGSRLTGPPRSAGRAHCIRPADP